MNSTHDGSKTGLEPIARRVPIRSKIDLRFHNFEGLVTGVSANLSTSGMFIQTDSPEAAGSECSFQIRIEDWSPIQGTAEVIWTRTTAEGPERPAGMGVRFVDLDPQSRRMIRWLVDKHLEDGGQPFDPTLVPPGASSVTRRQTDGPGSHAPPRGRHRSSAGSRVALRRLLLAVLLLAALAGLGYAAYSFWLGDRTESVVATEADGGRPEPADPDATTAGVALQSPVGTGSDEPPVSLSNEGVTSFIEAWESAWESRDAEAVTVLYSDNFPAQAYGGRSAWLAQVKRELATAEYVRVAVSALEIDFPRADTARASFFRNFRSDTRDETRRMVLELEPVEGSWRIRSERFVD